LILIFSDRYVIIKKHQPDGLEAAIYYTIQKIEKRKGGQKPLILYKIAYRLKI